MTRENPHTPENWGAASRGYATKIAPYMMRAYTDAFVDRLRLGPDAEVLEVAAGTGAMTEALYPRVKSLLATDFAPRMIEVLRERMTAAGATNIRFEVMDGEALDLEDDSFDAAASSFALMLFPDRAKGFSELRRVVRPGGRVVVSGWAGPEQFESYGLFLSAIQVAFPALPEPDEPPAVFSLADLDSFRAQMAAVGFEDIETEFISRDIEIADFDTLWGMLTAGAPPIKVLFDRVGPEGKDRIHDCLYEIVEDRFGSGPITLTNAATVGSARVP